jgi:hypothetical protein
MPAESSGEGQYLAVPSRQGHPPRTARAMPRAFLEAYTELTVHTPGDWRSDAPGIRRLIRASDLPAPYASPSTTNRVAVVEKPANMHLKVPPGFEVKLFASGLDQPRPWSLGFNFSLMKAGRQSMKLSELQRVSAREIADSLRTTRASATPVASALPAR